MSVYWQHHNDDGNNNNNKNNDDDTTAITLYTKFNSYNNSKPLTYLVPGELKQIQ